MRDHGFLNFLRRLRGWTPGRFRMMAEAKDARGHYFGVYEIRAEDEREAAARLDAHISAEGSLLVDIAETKPARVPFSPKAHVIQLSERVYMETSMPLERVDDV